MRRIGIDARLYYQTGVGVYLRNLLHNLQQKQYPDMEFYIYILEKDNDTISFDNPSFIKRTTNALWHSFSEQTSFYLTLMQDHLDLMHFTYFSYPILYKRPFIATVHDVTPLIYKTGRASTLHPLWYEIKHYVFQFVLSQQVKNAQKIITPTEYVKSQLGTIYGQKIQNKTQSIHEGVNYELIQADENRKLLNSYSEPFLLYVGNFFPHKNVGRLLDAYKLLNTKIPLVMVGPDNLFAGELKTKVQNEQIEGVAFHHSHNIEDICFFYKHALALINPSLSEGFGLPLIEAAYYNVPIIASDLEVFHEIFGKEYISFDPNSELDMKDKIELFLKNQTHPIFTQLTQFSFEKMTDKTVSLYTDLLS